MGENKEDFETFTINTGKFKFTRWQDKNKIGLLWKHSSKTLTKSNHMLVLYIIKDSHTVADGALDYQQALCKYQQYWDNAL